MKPPRINQIAAVIAGAFLFATVSLQAQTLYDVQCGRAGFSPSYTGTAVLGNSGDIWNAYDVGWYTYGSDSTTKPIADTTDNFAAGVTVTIWNYETGSNNSGGTTANPLNLMEGYITSSGAGDGWPIKVQLANLPDSTPFTLVVYASGDSSGQGATISLATDSTFGTILQSANTTGNDRDITQGQGDAYQLIDGTTSAAGTVDFEVANVSNWHALNGLQIEVVPEPSTWGLLLGGVGLLAVLQRKRLLAR